MPTLNINGQRVHVDDSFLKLSPEQQNSTVDEIARSLPKGGQSAPANDPASAPGNSPDLPQPSAAPVLPATPQNAPQYDGSGASVGNLANALGNSVFRGLPAALENGASVIGRTVAPNAGKPLWDALQQRAEGNRQALAQSYQHPAGVDPSPSHALASGDFSGALRSIGYNAAESLGPTAAMLGAAAIPYVGLPAAAAMGGITAADNINQEKQAIGLPNADRLTGADAANVAAQTALNAVPVVGKGLGSVSRAVAGVGQQFAKGAFGNALDAGSLKAQGGNVGGISDLLRNATDAGINRAAVAAMPTIPQAAKAGGQELNIARARAGDFGKGLSEYRNSVTQGVPLADMSARAKLALASLDRAGGGSGEGAQDQIKALRGMLAADPQAHGIAATPATIDRAFADAIMEAQSGKAGETTAQRQLSDLLPDELARPIETRLNTMAMDSQGHFQPSGKAVTAPMLRGLSTMAGAAGLGYGGSRMGGPELGYALASITRPIMKQAAPMLDSIGGKADEAMGIGVPDALRNTSAKQALAARMGMSQTGVGDQLGAIANNAHDSAVAALQARQGQAQANPTANGPMAHTAAEIAGQRVPGWAAKTADLHDGITRTGIMSYLSNRLADGRLSPDQYHYLTSTDNIGSNMGQMQQEMGALKHAGLWDKLSAFRDPDAPAALNASIQGTGSPDVDATGQPIRNRMSYQATIDREADTARQIITAKPHLFGAVAAMREAKTPEARTAIMRQEISKLPLSAQREALISLSPLSVFGYKGNARATD